MGRFVDLCQYYEHWPRCAECACVLVQHIIGHHQSITKEARNGKETIKEAATSPVNQGDELATKTQESEKGRLVWVPVLVTAVIVALALKANEGGSIRIGEYFTLDELTRTDTGLPNVPTGQSVGNLQSLVASILDPLRSQVGPLLVTSGYRSSAVNSHPSVNGAASSQHLRGQAADIVPTAASIDEAIAVLRTLPVDQVIQYSTHIHVSNSPNPRGEFLYKTNTGYEALI
jgi:zinc D-Ala-D-Ala carboxypeptidase